MVDNLCQFRLRFFNGHGTHDVVLCHRFIARRPRFISLQRTPEGRQSHVAAFAYFARVVRSAHALSGDELLELLETAVDQGMLLEEGADDVLLADVVVRGRRRDDRSEAYLVVEVSWGVGTGNVERAVRRASLLAQTGVQTLPVVAGERIADEAAELARAMHAWQVLDGQVIPPARPMRES
jgi:hypothetical protein